LLLLSPEVAGKDDGSGIKMEAAVPEEELDPVTLDAATAVTTTAIAAAITAAAAAAATSSESPITTTASSSTNLFPTPTPFDYDYDFMGDAAQRSTPNSHAMPKATILWWNQPEKPTAMHLKSFPKSQTALCP